MPTVKEELLLVAESLANDAQIDDAMYRLYVIDKIRKGREAYQSSETLTPDMLREEIASW